MSVSIRNSEIFKDKTVSIQTLFIHKGQIKTLFIGIKNTPNSPNIFNKNQNLKNQKLLFLFLNNSNF